MLNPFPPYISSDGSSYAFRGFGFPVLLFTMVLFSFFYYLVVFGSAPRVYPARTRPGPDGGDGDGVVDATPPVRVRGVLRRFSILRWANVRSEVHFDNLYDEDLARVYRFGRRWRVLYFLPGDEPLAARHGADGGAARSTEDGLTLRMFTYWFWGGSRLRETPPERLKARWQMFKTEVGNWLPRRSKDVG